MRAIGMCPNMYFRMIISNKIISSKIDTFHTNLSDSEALRWLEKLEFNKDDLNAYNDLDPITESRSPLGEACYTNDCLMLEWLYSKGADINQLDGNGASVLDWACCFSQDHKDSNQKVSLIH